MSRKFNALLSAACALAFLGATGVSAQNRAPEQWWVEKTVGGVYKGPMRPIWRKADLLKMHAGQDNWQEQIIKDPEVDATYNSAKPGSSISTRIHPDTPTVFVVITGEMTFNIEGQQPVSATRGSIVNVPRTTIYSADVKGATNALWVEVNPLNYKTLYPVAEAEPKAASGGKVIKVGFNHTPGKYTGVNKPHWNLFDALKACETRGARVLDDHQFVNPLIAYVKPSDDPCAKPPAAGAAPVPAPAAAAAPAKFDPKTTFGHMHAGPAEWWIVQVGQITGKFENTGEFHAVEGDVLYAAPMTWHQMGLEGSGPAVRTAMGAYNLINMNSNAAAGGGGGQ